MHVKCFFYWQPYFIIVWQSCFIAIFLLIARLACKMCKHFTSYICYVSISEEKLCSQCNTGLPYSFTSILVTGLDLHYEIQVILTLWWESSWHRNNWQEAVVHWLNTRSALSLLILLQDLNEIIQCFFQNPGG